MDVVWVCPVNTGQSDDLREWNRSNPRGTEQRTVRQRVVQRESRDAGLGHREALRRRRQPPLRAIPGARAASRGRDGTLPRQPDVPAAARALSVYSHQLPRRHGQVPHRRRHQDAVDRLQRATAYSLYEPFPGKQPIFVVFTTLHTALSLTSTWPRLSLEEREY